MAPADTSKNIVGKNGAATTTSCFSSTSSNSSSTTSGPGAAGGGGGRHGLMKKGPWTAAEDAILMEYVKKHGEGNWNAVQRNSGLMRCGKSCRLRWANHLRPNLKKGAFCSQEEALIVELHSKLGNKWARMAAQLPGRTDNEIKNYWNTRLKRRQRAGLPIYPHDVNSGGKIHTSYHRYQQENNIQAINNNPSPSLLSPPAAAALSSPASVPVVLNPGGYRTPLSLFDIFNPTVTNNSYLPNPTNCTQPFKFFQENNNNNNNIGGVSIGVGSGGGLALSLSSPPPHPPPPNSLSMPDCMQYNINCLNFGTDSIEQRTLGGSSSGGSGGGGGVELPSIQSSFVPRRTTTTTTTTTTSSDNNGSDAYNMIGTTSSDVDDHEDDFLRGNSGLLEDLIDESQALMTRSEKPKDMVLPAKVPAPEVEMIKSEDNYLWDYKVMEGLNLGHDNNVIHDKHVQDSTSPAHSSIQTEPANIASSEEESNPVDDDFMSLLDNFPMTVPVPDWCNENESMENGDHNNNNYYYSSSSEKENQNQPDQSSDFLTGGTPSRKTATATATATTDHNFDIGACCWKNLPGIYQM